MLEDIFSAIPLGIFLAFMLGPVFFVLLETAAIKGFRAALSFDIGVLIADAVFLIIAYFGTNPLLNRLKDDPALYIFGGTVLLTYGIITFIKVKRTTITPATFEFQKLKNSDYIQIAVKGFLLNFINIGVLGFWLGLIIIFGPGLEMQPFRLITFFSTILVTYLVVDVCKILLAKTLKHKLTPTRIAVSKKIISILIIIFGVVLILRGIVPKQVSKIEQKVEDQIHIETDSL
ncbi:LysE family translocator [Mesohalobacter halotolerans]|uniref:LysE family translocator n=1 Tax=Mesohalobacter halotolerans TaxID=1883405 RepID=A0A4U5TTS0_9FLAO|nr:LysE family transporter [Mesohalobacter halotolerans]TKS57482.1 LysE family translocator [Mesohalobacter halotolerans]